MILKSLLTSRYTYLYIILCLNTCFLSLLEVINCRKVIILLYITLLLIKDWYVQQITLSLLSSLLLYTIKAQLQAESGNGNNPWVYK